MSALENVKVLHVGKYYPPHQGGMETHLESLCRELCRLVNVEVLVSSDERRTTVEEIAEVKVTRVGKAFDLAGAPVCPEMVRRIREARADIVHIHLPNPTAIVAYLASGHRGPLIFSYHSDIIRQKVMGMAFEPLLRYALNRASAILVATPNHISSSPVLQKFKDRCRIVPYGISAKEFQQIDQAQIASIRRRYGQRIVLSVGRLVYYKGFQYLIRAMAMIDAQLIIVGSGPLHQELLRVAEASGVESRVAFLTDIKDIRPYYQAADVFTLPSVARSEAFGIVQLEAMACGKPVVNTQLDSGVPFVSPNGITGLTVPPSDSEALSQAINILLDDPERRIDYGRAGMKRVEEEFSLEVMTQRTVEIYQKVLSPAD